MLSKLITLLKLRKLVKYLFFAYLLSSVIVLASAKKIRYVHFVVLGYTYKYYATGNPENEFV